MSRVIGILATMDTKGAEAGFLRDEIKALGCETLLIDLGVVGEKDSAHGASAEALLDLVSAKRFWQFKAACHDVGRRLGTNPVCGRDGLLFRG